MKNKRFHIPGFSLIELLVVIAIIGVLASAAAVALSSTRIKARDTQRLAYIDQINTALGLYFLKNGVYPTYITAGQPLAVNGNKYLETVPTNPTPRTDGSCPDQDFLYTVYPGNTSYTLRFCLGTAASNFTGGLAICENNSCKSCGQYYINYGGQSYATVQIGSQCWMKENLNVGTMVNSQTTSPCTLVDTGNYSCQNDDSITEKYCYSNTASNCTTYGALYEWQEALGLSASCVNSDCSAQITSPHRGICPVGWHIPTDTEVNTLEKAAVQAAASTDTQYACNTSVWGWRRCADDSGTDGGGTKGAGKSLRATSQMSGDDLVGFSLLLGGYRSYNSTFANTGTHTGLWTATNNSTIYGLDRLFYGSYTTVYRSGYQKAQGFAVRCLKD